MILGISLSIFHKIIPDKDINKTLDAVRSLNLGINALELTFYKDIFINKISDINYKYLKKKELISCHINEYMSLEEHNEKRKNLIDNLAFNFYICHSDYKNKKQIKKAFSNTLIENIDSIYERTFFEEPLCCDISHLLAINEPSVYTFITANKKNIKQFHISNHTQGYLHTTFNDKKNYLLERIISFIKKEKLLDIPFIIEGNFNNIHELQTEIKYIKEKFLCFL